MSVMRRIEAGGMTTAAVVRAFQAFVTCDPGKTLDQAIEDSLRAVAHIDRFYLYECRGTRRPRMIASRCEAQLADRVHVWGDRFFIADPVRVAIAAADSAGVGYTLRVEANDLAMSDYRATFFDRSDIAERVSFVQRDDDRHLVLHIARKSRAGQCSDVEMTSLSLLSQFLLPVAAQRMRPAPSSEGTRNRILQLEGRLAARFPGLTIRERAVCARAVIGMTAEAAALDLAIGKATVKTLRRRAYHRLNISSVNELAALILH